ncbi:Anaphase-promoting complex (APC), subunit 11 [Handroanthus impetiginosus]|uniref:RING-type E3 ubiquitin transferase n=1 Tax=Handroanthus impetiginosus TaxID=429701 RepID=A0A2G9GA58_9LAMI|nr:Anaphase-promoting complex (APC), subunit 11 [Handroanthus impetiginosus]
MNAIFEQILLFLFFVNFPKTILSKNLCPSSSCGIEVFSNVPIRYPFKLQTDSPPERRQDYIILRCNNQSRALINLPSSGDFYVTDIDYCTQKSYLSEPENCLPKRLMTSSSLSRLEAFRYENYTSYLCPRKRIMFQFGEIECLSNSTNVTIATNSRNSREFMEKSYGCRAIVSSMIPVSPTFEYGLWWVFGDLQLTWNVSGCEDCEDAYGAGNSGDSKSKWEKLLGSPLFILSTCVLISFFGVACFLRATKIMVTEANTNNATENNPTPGSAMTGRSTIIAPPQPVGIDASKLKNCTELVVLSECLGTSLATGGTCSICLEEYHGEVTVRYLPHCGHYFHVECIDQWFQKNSTCPVCRTTPFE